jgi:hypothetical protein
MTSTLVFRTIGGNLPAPSSGDIPTFRKNISHPSPAFNLLCGHHAFLRNAGNYMTTWRKSKEGQTPTYRSGNFTTHAGDVLHTYCLPFGFISSEGCVTYKKGERVQRGDVSGVKHRYCSICVPVDGANLH